MNIDVIRAESHPTKKRKTTSASSRGQDEAQSSAPPQSPSAPSFANAAIQHYLNTEFRKMGEGFVKVFKSDLEHYTKGLLTASREYFSGKSLEDAILSLTKDLISFKDIVLSKFDSLQSSVTGLDSRVGSIEQFIREYQASSSAAPPPPASHSPEDPPADAVLAMIDFSSSILNPEPQPIPAQPESSLAPSDSPIVPQPLSDPVPSTPVEESQPSPVPQPSSPHSPLV